MPAGRRADRHDPLHRLLADVDAGDLVGSLQRDEQHRAVAGEREMARQLADRDPLDEPEAVGLVEIDAVQPQARDREPLAVRRERELVRIVDAADDALDVAGAAVEEHQAVAGRARDDDLVAVRRRHQVVRLLAGVDRPQRLQRHRVDDRDRCVAAVQHDEHRLVRAVARPDPRGQAEGGRGEKRNDDAAQTSDREHAKSVRRGAPTVRGRRSAPRADRSLTRVPLGAMTHGGAEPPSGARSALHLLPDLLQPLDRHRRRRPQLLREQRDAQLLEQPAERVERVVRRALA